MYKYYKSNPYLWRYNKGKAELSGDKPNDWTVNFWCDWTQKRLDEDKALTKITKQQARKAYPNATI